MIFVSSSSSRRRSKASSVSVSVCSSGGILREHTPHSTHTHRATGSQAEFFLVAVPQYQLSSGFLSLPLTVTFTHCCTPAHTHHRISGNCRQLERPNKQTLHHNDPVVMVTEGLDSVCVCVVPSVESSSTGTDAPRLVCSSSAPLSVRRRLSASQSACLFVSPDHLVNLSVSRLQLSQLSQ